MIEALSLGIAILWKLSMISTPLLPLIDIYRQTYGDILAAKAKTCNNRP